MIGRTISHYRITAELGSGGMGVVYRAEDLRLGRAVALKFLPEALSRRPEALERFRREARAASTLNHPHICTIHEIDEHDGQPFIVMELLEGHTLAQRIAARRPALDEVLDLSMQIAEGLEVAHAKGIVHRDIKSANIFVNDRGQVKILDFGLAKVASDGVVEAQGDGAPTVAPTALTTEPGQAMGTVAYMSPEQVRGENLDARTDIFSLGVVMYELATGRQPFEGASTGLVFEAVLNRTPPSASRLAPAVPAELDRIIGKALEKDRDLRYQSARDLRADLARLRRDSGSTATVTAAVTAATATRPHPQRRALTLVGIGLGALLLGAAALAVWLLRDGRRSGPPPSLSRATFEPGLQAQPTWSPDGRFIAYSSNDGGNFDIWVQPLAGGRAVQITTNPANDWQPAWSPDGNTIAFRSEREGGGIYAVPALGGNERRLAAFGNWPQWSPHGSELLFVVSPMLENASRVVPRVYAVGLDGGAPVRVLEDALSGFVDAQSIGWHPDGRRVTFAGTRNDGVGGLWITPRAGGAVVPVEFSPETIRGLEAARLSPGRMSWAPTGDAIYLEATSNGIVNLWRVGVDPRAARIVSGPERLTTGLGIDSDVAVSPDGLRLAFVTRTETSRLWSIPLEGGTEGDQQAAEPITDSGAAVFGFDLSADGRRLVFGAGHAGREEVELRMRSFDDGTETLLGEALAFFAPRFSRDGTLVAYRVTRQKEQVEMRTAWMPVAGGDEFALPLQRTAWDWSPDGERILHGCPPPERPSTLCESPRRATTTAETRTLLVDPDYDIWQGRYSPDGRWVLFNAQNTKDAAASIVGVVPAAGGAWVPITDRALWADKPRWGPDGRSIYFISNQEGAFFNVWRVGFDPGAGRAVGDVQRVTRYDDPGRLITASASSELGVSATRLVVPIVESTGSVWLLDNISP